MEHNEIYTITIIRRLAQPLSLTIKRRTVLLILVAVLAVFGLLFLATIDYLLLNQRADVLETELRDTKTKLTQVTNIVRQMDKERFGQGVDYQALAKERLLKQKPVEMESLVFVQNKPNLQEVPEGVQINVTDIEATLQQDTIRMKIQIENRSTPPEDQSGYLSVTFMNQEEFPTLYKSASGGELGEAGFPANFKSGRDFFIGANRSAAVRLDYALKEKSEYYTHIMVLAYSPRGTLLTKHVAPLNRNLFFQ